MPDVSICIVNWNGKVLLRNLLESLRTPDGGITIQTIVVDNASTDGSLDAIPTDFPDVVLVPNDRNLGFAKANNQAADRATGRYLLFLNNDTVVQPGALARLVQFMDENAAYAAVGPKLIGGDGKPQRTGRNLPTFRALLHQRVMLIPRWTGIFKHEYREYRSGDFDPEVANDVPQLAAAALLVRPARFVEAGRWDEGFPFGVEDVDLCVRLRKFGPIRYLPDAQILHLGRISSTANYGFTYTSYECGYARYFKKHHRNPSAGRWYKTIVTLDMPLRLLVLGAQTVGYTLLFRRRSAARSYRRLAAAAGFFFREMGRFWKA